MGIRKDHGSPQKDSVERHRSTRPVERAAIRPRRTGRAYKPLPPSLGTQASSPKLAVGMPVYKPPKRGVRLVESMAPAK